ncbi:MAG: YjjG family noncanonical pyrimidine nucleotidase [Tissierellia bacterium]|nr:YjjG family noncanonical pyrimidine nucleotidase [Tissierellia bacterium]
MMNFKDYNYILFDADNTILDFNKSQRFALEKTFKDFDINFDDETIGLYHEISRDLWGSLEKGYIKVDDIKVERFKRLIDILELNRDEYSMSESFLNNLASRGDIVEGADFVLSRLSQDKRLFIASNGYYDVQMNRIKNSGLDVYFTDFFISEEIGFSKPDKRFFEIAGKRMGKPDRKEMLMVGDSETSDIDGAINYGIDSCIISNEKITRAVYRIENILQMIECGGI